MEKLENAFPNAHVADKPEVPDDERTLLEGVEALLEPREQLLLFAGLRCSVGSSVGLPTCKSSVLCTLMGVDDVMRSILVFTSAACTRRWKRTNSSSRRSHFSNSFSTNFAARRSRRLPLARPWNRFAIVLRARSSSSAWSASSPLRRFICTPNKRLKQPQK